MVSHSGITSTNGQVRHPGFTLVELLVVVAIIIALLAMLLPSMGRAVEMSNRAVCASRQHQTSALLLGMATDRFGVLPDWSGEDIHWINKAGYDDAVNYFVDWTITECPNFAEPTLADDAIYGDVTLYAKLGFVYLGNKSVSTYPGPNNKWLSPTRLSDAKADTAILADRDTMPAHTWTSKAPHSAGGWVEGPPATTPDELGTEGVNHTTIDGAARWVAADQMQPHAGGLYLPPLHVFWW